MIVTVRNSSSGLVLKVCSQSAYMIRPMPKEGSITAGTISSTAKEKEKLKLGTKIQNKYKGQYMHTYE